MENTVGVLHNENRTTISSINPTVGYISEENKKHFFNMTYAPQWSQSVIYNIQCIEAT